MSRVNQFDQQKAEEALAKFVCSASLAPRSACYEDGPFRQVLNALNPNFRPTFKSLERNCLKIYAQEQKKVKETFSKLGGHMSLSMDILMQEDNYICLTAHFIDDDWKLQKWVIKYAAQNQDFLSKMILKVLKEWDIEGKLLSITAGGNTDVVEVVKEDIQKRSELVLNGQVFDVKCSCDVISRMVQEGYEEISDIISKVEMLSWSKSLPLWYLTSCKLRDALELDALGEFSSENVLIDYDVPSKEEWEKVRSMCRIVDRIYEIVEGLFEVKRPTANLFLPHMHEIFSFLTLESASSDVFVKTVAQKMLEIFNGYWKDMYMVLAIASFMDPRYKMKFIEFSSSKINGEANANLVLETIRKLYDSYVVENYQKEYLLSDSSSESEEEGSDRYAKKQRRNLVDKLNILRDYRCSIQSNNDCINKSDLDLYMEEPIFEWTENFSVLKWWKDNCGKYPRLSRMARDFLAIPMSVATSWEAYYTEPREVDRTVVSLKPELMNALMCTRSWKFSAKED